MSRVSRAVGSPKSLISDPRTGQPPQVPPSSLQSAGVTTCPAAGRPHLLRSEDHPGRLLSAASSFLRDLQAALRYVNYSLNANFNSSISVSNITNRQVYLHLPREKPQS